jgi:ABC-2 type transport system permease protein
VSAVLRSELLKQRTTRTILQLPLWMVGLVALVVLLHVFSLDAATLSRRDGQLKVIGWGTSVGALSITSEIRHGTIRPTFLATPRRARVIFAKVVARARRPRRWPARGSAHRRA